MSDEASGQPRLLDQVRQTLRVGHYSIHTERAYMRNWIVRFVRFHVVRSREGLFLGATNIEAFLTHLATAGDVAAATQNQAMNALVFLYKRVMQQPLDGRTEAVGAERRATVPVVLSKEEIASALAAMTGTPRLVVRLRYASGLRISEALRLRVRDVDFGLRELTARPGKGKEARDRARGQWRKRYGCGRRGSRAASESTMSQAVGTHRGSAKRTRPATARQ